jgi:hypothetical protein
VRTPENIRNKGTFVIVASNNHCTELGIATPNSIRNLKGLKEAEWEVMKQAALWFRIEIVKRREETYRLRLGI